MNIDELNNIYQRLDTLRLEVYRHIEDYEYTHCEFNKLLSQSSIKLSTQATWNNNILKFAIPELLPNNKHKSDKKWYNETKSFWVRNIVKSFNDLGNKQDIFFEKAFIYIKIILPYNCKWDLDNRCYDFIIDGIRHTKIIKDDSYDNINYFITGSYQKNSPETIIYVTDSKKIMPIIDNVFANI